MVMTDGIEDFGGNARRSLQHFIARRRMGLDQRALPVVEAPGLVENRERDSCLADVVKHCGGIQPLDISPGHAEAQAEIDGHPGDQRQC